MQKESTAKLYYGAIIHSSSLTRLQALPRAFLAISALGVIVWLEEDVSPSSLQEIASKHGWDVQDPSITLIQGRNGEWLMPGFVDTHTHAPQFPNLGTGQQYQLLDWLDNVTFPTEARFADVAYARRAYESVVTRVLNYGTTTCCYYGTLHFEATKILADIVHEKGQRGFIGKCNMDRNSPPTYIEPSAKESVFDTIRFIEYVQSLEAPSKNVLPLVRPILTPRFAISCTDELLTPIGQIYHSKHAASHDVTKSGHPPLLLQTHIAENLDEGRFTEELFRHLPPPTNVPPSHSRDEHSYTSIYDYFGLLDSRTILAHGVHLSEPELDLIKERGVGLSHCAGSNFNLRSGVARVGHWLDKGIKVGLGTDVSGGFTPSILNEIRHASIASKVRPMIDSTASSLDDETSDFSNPQGLSLATLLHLATLGGAALCNLDDKIGSFAPGKDFDALFVSISDSANPSVWSEGVEFEENLESMLERFVFGGDDRNIKNVWVRGRLVGGTGFKA